MSNIKRILNQYEEVDNSELPKVKIKGSIYYFDESKYQYISVENQHIVVSAERIRKANIQVEKI